MNSIIQCLLHSNELFAYFLNEYPNDCVNLKKKNKHIESQGNISRTFYNIVKGVQPDNHISKGKALNAPTGFAPKVKKKDGYEFSNNSKPFSPSQFKQVLGNYNYDDIYFKQCMKS